MCWWIRRSPSARESRRDQFDDAAVDRAVEELLAERAALIELCVYAMDRARSSGVTEKLAEGLDCVGVVPLRPDGERFDPACHEAGGTVVTDDPVLDGRIATTELPGFRDRGRVLRVPVVVVYRLRDAN